MKIFVFLSLLILAVACNDSSSNTGGNASNSTGGTTTPTPTPVPTPAVEGSDYSGNYTLLGVVCFDQSGNQTAEAGLAPTSATQHITLVGNNLSAIIADANCTATETAHAVFDDSNPADPLLTLTQTATTTSTHADCALSLILLPVSGGTITPSPFTQSFSDQAQLPDSQVNYIRDPNSGVIGLSSSFQVQGSPTDICATVYQKN